MTGDPLPGFRIRRLQDGRTECLLLLPPGYPGFQGHFPGEPVLPGMCHIALAARAAAAACGREVRLATILRARFSRKVVPGEELRILLSVEETASGTLRVQATHSVGEETAAQVRFEVEPLPAPDRRAGPGVPRD